jgi:folate-binding protein YgfZ
MNDSPASIETPADQAQPLPARAWVALAHFGLIRVAGQDTRRFLQGQLGNDVNQVTPEMAQLSSQCSPKGRMLTTLLVFQRGDDLYLQLPRERLADTLKRLQMFVLRSQVTLDDASEALVRLGLAGDGFEAAFDTLPARPFESVTRDDLTVIRLPGDRPRFQLVGPADAVAAARARLPQDTVEADADFWSLMDIRAGVPNVWQETVDGFVPQMANLQLLGGISFTKGCYTGQEVVARMQYLGKLKRRMYRAHVATDGRPAPGTEVFAPGSESGQGAGRVVEAAPAPDGGYEMLVVLQISSADAGELRLHDADGAPLALRDLPYAFDEA